MLFERYSILVACQIRVLLERRKVRVSALRTSVTAQRYAKSGRKRATLLNAVALEEQFDLFNPVVAQMRIRDACDQLVHHDITFAMRGERTQFDTVCVCSDYKRDACLHELAVPDLLRAFAVLGDEASALSGLDPRNGREVYAPRAIWPSCRSYCRGLT